MWTFIVPVHNEAATLAATVARLDAARSRYDIGQVIAVENGSRDASWTLLQELAAANPWLRGFTEPSAGIGYAYDRGIREALRVVGPAAGVHLVLTACDLPFGFTDLDSALSLPTLPAVVIGSKAHLVGAAAPGFQRRAASSAYRLARRWLVGMRTRDSQGSFLLRADVASGLVDDIEARNFFYTTELCALLERRGVMPIEVAVTLEEERRSSTVRPLKHGTAMLRQLLRLRRRLADQARP
jgi:glycosyltransferase involved in cell wall biosynthesis